eukprot:TRINITY_DN41894_c0_g1_i1.p1 TRINITY_DN41894_c0_g1~~TRINITY_DN41894_c0_g1_i1.p1  ORF type:complete len:425 (-),score=69.24 TRINITY_DN41894_c0_g1_i1:33-1256(-)
MVSRGKVALYVNSLLVCGSLNTITMKIAFTMSGTNSDGEKETFQKPWLITFVMFFAMSLALPCDRTMWSCCGAGAMGQEPLIDKSPGSQDGPSWSKKVVLVSIPAFFDILATGLCCMGFLYIPASVWQLLRGAEMVFAAIFAVTCLGQKLFSFHWLGIVSCVIGIICVGLASVWGEQSASSTAADAEKDAPENSMMIVGISLALAGQVVQAAQVVAEEWLLKEADLPGLQIVGFEGMWGSLAMLVVVMPLLYVLPGADHGHLEDEIDSWVLLGSNPHLCWLMALYTFSCSTYNMAGIAVTGALSAVHRVMLEALRTLIVWAFGLIVHYKIDPSSKLGEAWTPYSLLEVAGFVLLILGQALYGGMLKVPGLYYPPDDSTVPLASPGALRNLASPLPRNLASPLPRAAS